MVGDGPVGIAIDYAGNVWVANQGYAAAPGNTVTELSSSGALLGTFTVGSGPTGIAIASGSTIDPAGNVWVSNQYGDTVTELSPSGGTLDTFPVGYGPSGIAIDSLGNVWVANVGSNSTSLLAGVAKGPEFFPYQGPVWP
jgi:DNA-binding beta-propeller fold protein YncE